MSAMSELKWTSNEIFKFIELYRMEPAIWNPKEKFHKDKNAVNDSWRRIADEMLIPVQELKKKKETLMSAFRMNHKKVVASKKSGASTEDIFRPIWAYYDVMAAFMNDVYDCKSILSTEIEVNSENEENDIEVDIPSSVRIPTKKRRCQQPIELNETRAQMNAALITLNNALNNPKKENVDEDNCSLYGKLLANKLRAYSETERHVLMHEIDGFLLQRPPDQQII